MLKTYKINKSISDIIQLKIDTKIDWCSFVFHIEEDLSPDEIIHIKSKIIGKIIERLDLDISETNPNFMRSHQSIAIFTNLKKSIKVEVEGSYFRLDRDNFKELVKIQKELNEITSDFVDSEKIWNLSRLDIARTVIGIDLESLIPSEKDNVEYLFRYKTVEYKNSTGILETKQITSGKVNFVFYRKDIEMRNLSSELKSKKITERKYIDTNEPVTRCELRLKSGADSLILALELIMKNEISEKEFCFKILKHATHKRRVRIKSKDTNKRRWNDCPKWAAIFQSDAEHLAVDKSILKNITRPQMGDLTNREVSRFQNFINKYELSLDEVTTLLKGKERQSEP